MAKVVGPEERGNLVNMGFDIGAGFSVHHGEEIIVPVRQVARTPVRMRDKRQGTNLWAEL